MTFASIRRRAVGLERAQQVASGRQWRDDQGRPLAFLDKAGLHEEAARVRAAHGRPSATAGHRKDEPREPAAKRIRAAGAPRTSGQLYCGEEDGLGDLGDDGSQFVECCRDAAHADQHQTRAGGGWSSSLLRQPICMAWDSANSSMTVPVDGSRVFHGFVESAVERSGGAQGPAGYMCWFDDHSIELVSEDTLRLCVVSTAASENIQALTAEAVLVIAACGHVFGRGAMPPCVRDRGDGKSQAAAVLVFSVKSLRLSRHAGVRSVIDAVDDRAPALVEFFDGRRHAGIQASSCCSLCHSITQQRETALRSHTSGASSPEACKHILAIRHMWRRAAGSRSCLTRPWTAPLRALRFEVMRWTHTLNVSRSSATSRSKTRRGTAATSRTPTRRASPRQNTRTGTR
jgi:hypothetical protein